MENTQALSGDRLLIDGSWFDDNLDRGYIIKEDDIGTYIIDGGEEKIYTRDIPKSKITICDKQQLKNSGLLL